MSPEQMVQQIAALRVVGPHLIVRWRDKSPDAVEALKQMKPAVVLLHEAAGEAGCAEPLSVLLHEFRHDLELIAQRTWTVPQLARAVRNIGSVRGWQTQQDGAA